MVRMVKNTAAALARTEKPIDSPPIAHDAMTADGLENVVAGLGTGRDKMSHTHWVMPVSMNRYELEALYKGSWLARKIVDLPARDMTREGWTHYFPNAESDGGDVMGDASDDGVQAQKLVKTMETAEKRFAINTKVRQCLQWARLYGGAFLLIGTRDADLSKPLDVSKIKKGDLRYLQVIDRWRMAPSGMINRDLTSANFGMPDSYLLAESSVRVHHTRVIRFNGNPLPYFLWLANGMWDDSVLQAVRDSMRNYDVTSHGIASMIFEANVDVVAMRGLVEILSQKGGEAILTKRFQTSAMMKSFNRMLLLDEGDVYDKKSNNFANLDKIMAMFMTDVSGAVDIPKTRLFGDSPKGLQSTGKGEEDNYEDKVRGDQEEQLRPKLDYLFEIIIRSELGQMPEGHYYEFNPLSPVSDADKADWEDKQANRDQTYVGMGAIDVGLVAKELLARGTYQAMTQADVDRAMSLTQPMDEQGMLGLTPAKAPGPFAASQVAGVEQPDQQQQPKKPKGITADSLERYLRAHPDILQALVTDCEGEEDEPELEEITEEASPDIEAGDFNQSHDPANGEFSSGGGGEGKHEAAARKFGHTAGEVLGGFGGGAAGAELGGIAGLPGAVALGIAGEQFGQHVGGHLGAAAGGLIGRQFDSLPDYNVKTAGQAWVGEPNSTSWRVESLGNEFDIGPWQQQDELAEDPPTPEDIETEGDDAAEPDESGGGEEDPDQEALEGGGNE